MLCSSNFSFQERTPKCAMGSPDSNESLQKKRPAKRPHSNITPDRAGRDASGGISSGEGSLRKMKAAGRDSPSESKRSDSGHVDNPSNRDATQHGFQTDIGQNALTVSSNSNEEGHVLLHQMILQRLQDGIQPAQLLDRQISGLLSRAQQFGPQSLNLQEQHELLMLHRDRHQREMPAMQFPRASLAVASTEGATLPSLAFRPKR